MTLPRADTSVEGQTHNVLAKVRSDALNREQRRQELAKETGDLSLLQWLL